jgi:glycerol kinase
MDLLLSFQADLLGVRVVRAAVNDTTALGAALLAGLAEGVWLSLEDIASRWLPDSAVDPAADTTIVEAAYQRWRRAVHRTTQWTSP